MNPCPYCQSNNTHVFYETQLPLYLWPLKKEMASENRIVPLKAVLCHNCLYAFNAEKLDDDTLTGIYDNYMFSFPSKGIGHSSFTGIFDLIDKHTRPSERIIEIGASDGYVLKSLWQKGYKNLLGIDPNPRIPADYPVEFQKGYFDETTDCGEVDVFILIHVLEHFEKPWDILNTMGEKLKTGGRIIVEVPAAEVALLHQHLSFFTPEFLERLGRDYGFYVKDASFSGNISRIVYEKGTVQEGVNTNKIKFENRADTIAKINDIKRKKGVFEKDINEFLAMCAGETVYWWGTGSSALIGFQSIKDEVLKDLKIVVIDSDETRRGLIFTPLGQEVYSTEEALREVRGQNIVLASVLYVEMFEMMKQLGCEPGRVFFKDRDFWI